MESRMNQINRDDLQVNIPHASRYRDISFRVLLNAGLPVLDSPTSVTKHPSVLPVSTTTSKDITLAKPGTVKRVTPTKCKLRGTKIRPEHSGKLPTIYCGKFLHALAHSDPQFIHWVCQPYKKMYTLSQQSV